MAEIRDEYDSPWKDILELYFEDFMAFFFPQIHGEIDWARGYEFLDQELSQITRDAEVGKKVVDKLVKVWKLTGEETWVLLNVEIQSQEESVLAERVFTYFYRLKDKFNLPVASLVILGTIVTIGDPIHFPNPCGVAELSLSFRPSSFSTMNPNGQILRQVRIPLRL